MSRKGPNSVLIISARFYEDIADELSRGATEELRGNDVEFEEIAVPGALEIPLALSLALANGLSAAPDGIGPASPSAALSAVRPAILT